jgi:tetratricopeptide (TPR) repeat protein
VINASLVRDIEGLTPALIACVVLVLGVLYRRPIGTAVERLKGFAARRKDAEVEGIFEPPPSQGAIDSGRGEPTDETAETKEELVADDAAADPEPDDKNAVAARSAMLNNYFEGKEVEGDKDFEQLRRLETDPAELKLDRARREAARYMSGIDPAGLEHLKAIAGEDDMAGFAYRMIGLCLAEAGRNNEAAEYFRQAIDASQDAEDKAKTAELRATALSEIEKTDQAAEELQELIRNEPNPLAQITLWSSLVDTFRRAGKTELRATAAHRLATLVGNDSERWFTAAYAYGECDADFVPLSIHCYFQALRFNSSYAAALNNLGVKYAELGLPVLATRRYREAFNQGNTLAAGNLASKYLRAGFEAEAETLIEEAQKRENVATKVAEVAAEISSAQSSEQEKLDQIRGNAGVVAEAVTAFANLRLEQSPQNVGHHWIAGGEPVEVTVDRDEIQATWKVGTYRGARRFIGTLEGAAAVGRFEKQGPSYGPEWEADATGYLLFSSPTEVQVVRLRKESAELSVFAVRDGLASGSIES